MYTQLTFRSEWLIDHDIYFKGDHGEKGEKKKERDLSPEKVREWNLRKKEKYIRRLIQANFAPGDPFITLKYPKGEHPDIDSVKKHFTKFQRILRSHYKKLDTEFKFIYRLEIGKRGGIHLHVVLNRCPNMLEVFTLAWQKARGTTPLQDMISMESTELPRLVRLDGKVNMQILYLEGGYHDLAEYMCKPLPGEESMTKEERKKVSASGSSRNIIRPVPERRQYTHWTVRRIIEAGPEKINTDPLLRKRYLHPGFIIDKSTWHAGVNPVTGLSFIEYTEVRIT